MKNILIFIITILFYTKKNSIILNILYAYNIWSTKLFPIIFPSLILCDLISSSNLINILNKLLKKYSYYIYTLIITIIAGTPTNSKILLNIYNNKIITKEELNVIICTNILFNPLFVISYTSIKIYIICILSNIIVLFINKNKLKNNNIFINNKFNLNNSINNNINICIMILGNICCFFSLSSLININYISALLEVTTGLTLFNNNEFIKLIILNLGGISIFFQIKSILKDALDIKYYFITRLKVTFISILLYMCTINL